MHSTGSPDLGTTLAILMSANVSSAKFDSTGALLEVAFFSPSGATTETVDDSKPEVGMLDGALLRLATRGVKTDGT